MSLIDARSSGSTAAGPMQFKLDTLNFFLADVRGGMGAFVSVFLVTAAGWSPAEIGVVLTVSGLIGIAAHVPVGAGRNRTPPRAECAPCRWAVQIFAGEGWNSCARPWRESHTRADRCGPGQNSCVR
jgi:hypothetical protein